MVTAETLELVLGIEPDIEMSAEAGGKATGLRLLARSGLPLPRSWVVLPGSSDGSIAALGTDLRREGITTVAVRSSAIDEDDRRFSFAGIHETLLGVTVEELPEAIETVARSALSDRARAYRTRIGLPPPGGPCAVIVQKMIESDSAGIAFGAEGDDRVVIEAVEGLGETAVNGQVIPEMLIVDRPGEGWVVERRRERFQEVMVELADRGTRRTEIPGTRQRSHVLTDDQAREIAAGVIELQRAAGTRLDVEWAFREDEIWFLQARPQTKPVEEALAPGQVWTRVNAREVLPDIPSAFARSTIPEWLDTAEQNWMKIHGLEPDPPVPMFTFIYGRPVFNDQVFLVGELLGVPRASMEADLGGATVPDDGFHRWSTIQALRHPRVLVGAIMATAGAERRANIFISELRVAYPGLAAINVEAAPLSSLVEIFRGPEARQLGRMASHAIAVAALLARAQYFAIDLMKQLTYPRARLAKLVSGGDLTVSTRQVEDLQELALLFREWIGARHFLDPVTPNHRSPDWWRRKLPHWIWAAVELWLDSYGHRGPYESDLARPRYADDASLLAAALAPFVTGRPPRTAAERAETRQREADAAWSEIEASLGPLRTRWLRRLVRDVKRLTMLRERLRSEAMRGFLPLRRVGTEIGRRFAEEGRLGDQAEVWHLTLEEIEQAVSDRDFDLRIAVAREVSRISAWRRIDVPNSFTSEGVPALATRIPEGDRATTTFAGNGISPGIVEGVVRIIRSPTDGERFDDGGVLVAPATDPSWTPIFARAVAVVVELGGTLSHAGIVAREYGIPCVANIDGVTRHLRDGDSVRVDGSRGLVTLLARPGERFSRSRAREDRVTIR